MEHIGIDERKKESQTCMLAEEGERIERRIRTDARALDVSRDDGVERRVVLLDAR